MKGYLSQIGSAGGAGLSPAPLLRPFIRSRSPIAENDQRIGISGWEFPMSSGGDEALPSDAAAPENITQPVTRAGARQSAAGRQNPTPNVASGPEPSESPAAPATMVVAPSRLASGEPKPFSPDPQSRQPVSGSAFEPKAHSKREILHQENELPGIRPKDDRRTVAAFVESKTSASTIPSQQSITSVEPPYPNGPGLVARKQDPPSDFKEPPGEGLERVPIQLGPGRVVAPYAGEPGANLTTTEASIARHDRENAPRVPFNMPAAVAPLDSRAPQVVIDRLEIEVVPPPVAAAPKPSGKPDRESGAGRPQRPVSQIGPLSQSTASRNYLSLRYR